MATARKLPSGQWRTLIYSHTENGKRIYESFTAATKKESEFLAAQFKHLNTNSSDLTVSNALNRYIAIKKNILSPKTYREYSNMIKSRYTLIDNIPLKKLNDSIIQNWINKLSENLSPKTVRNIYGLLTATIKMFNQTYSCNITLPQKKQSSIYVPTDNDIENLFIFNKDRNLEIAMLLAAFGSLRRSEICALNYEDINNNDITINKALVLNEENQYVLKQPKTFTSYRTINMPSFVIEKIGSGTGRIITVSPDIISSKFRRLLKQNNLPHFRFHDLRHYQASILHALGIPDKYIMERGGWSSPATLNNIYKHTLKDKQSDFNTIANAYFENMQHKMQHSKK